MINEIIDQLYKWGRASCENIKSVISFCEEHKESIFLLNGEWVVYVKERTVVGVLDYVLNGKQGVPNEEGSVYHYDPIINETKYGLVVPKGIKPLSSEGYWHYINYGKKKVLVPDGQSLVETVRDILFEDKHAPGICLHLNGKHYHVYTGYFESDDYTVEEVS